MDGTRTSTDNPITAIRDRLGPNGEHWAHGNAGIGEASECLIVATARALRVRELHDVALDALMGVILDQYADRVLPIRDRIAVAVALNDHPDTTWADIEQVLDKAEVALAERVTA